MSRLRLGLALLLCALSATCWSEQVAGGENPDAVEEVAFEIVGEPASSSFGPAIILGRLHPAAVHLPIAWLFLALLLEFWPQRSTKWNRRACGRALAWLCVLASIPAVVSGLLRAEEMATQDGLSSHRNLMLLVSGLMLLLAALRQWLDEKLQGPVGRWGLRGLLLSCTLLMGWAAHLGGRLVFGADHLPW